MLGAVVSGTDEQAAESTDTSASNKNGREFRLDVEYVAYV